MDGEEKLEKVCGLLTPFKKWIISENNGFVAAIAVFQNMFFVNIAWL